MKKFLLLASMAIVFACTPKHDGYIIEGTVTGDNISDGKAYLTNFSRSEPIKDTVEFTGGKFTFKGKVVTPENYSISIDGLEGRVNLFVDNSTIKIEMSADDMKNAVITGGVTNDLIKGLNDQKDEIKKKYNLDSLLTEFYKEETSNERKDEIIAVYEEATKEEKVVDSAFLANNPLSFYTVIKVYEKAEELPIEKLDAMVSAFKAAPEFAGNRYLTELENTSEILKKLQPGMVAPEFSLNDPNGNAVSLSSVYKNNKITMIDFWAGWCNPCRKFNPVLVEIYKKYNKAGFGIIGVSLDNDENVWKKAIEDDKLTWIQVSDLQYFNGPVTKMYNVRFIPQNIFVDQDGKIIKRQVEKDDIEPLLKEHLGL